MITLIEDQWAGLEELCRVHRVQHVDVLTGFLGTGACRALASLGVNARIIVGMPHAEAASSVALIAEIGALRASHEVRWLPGLHGKLYLLDRRVVVVGSANFTRSGFERLDELAIATDDPDIVARSASAFETRWARAKDLDPSALKPLPVAAVADDGEPLDVGLGIAWRDRASGFSMRASAPGTVTGGADGAHSSTEGVSEFMYANVGEGPHRCWEDCRRYGFLAAGHGAKWSQQLWRLVEGARVYAYLKNRGYVGLGTVLGPPRMAMDLVLVDGSKLFDHDLQQPGLKTNASDPELCEWVVPIHWRRTFDSSDAKGFRLFSSPLVACRLNQLETLHLLASEFGDPRPSGQ